MTVEYKILQYHSCREGQAAAVEELNSLAAKGWRVISALPANGYNTRVNYTLERAVPPTNA